MPLEEDRFPPGPERTAYIVDRIRLRFSLQSIADNLGITRERVRQIALKEGIKASAFGPRPYDTERTRKRLEAQRQRQRERHAVKKMQRYNLVADLREMASDLGRAPTLKEFAARTGKATASISGAFYSRKNRFRGGTHYGRIGTARLYRLAGLTPWKPGHNPKTHPRGAESECSSNPPSV